MPQQIFVFGSNLAGRHGRGAAYHAWEAHGAIRGQGVGLQGRSYAIPTKDEQLVSLPVLSICWHVVNFLEFAKAHPEMQFNITPIGCGLAKYKPDQIGPLFDKYPPNCVLPEVFKPYAKPA